MGMPRGHPPVLLVVAAFSRHPKALTWAQRRLTATFGPIALAGPLLDFDQTTYYQRSMGPGLHKQLLAFRDLVGPEQLAAIKRTTNELEQELAGSGLWPEERPLNLDPGILTLGKFQLATTKDQAHRVYLRDGIFAEVTLRFRAGEWVPWPWTYADYRQPAVLAFLRQAREFYRQRLEDAATISGDEAAS